MPIDADHLESLTHYELVTASMNALYVAEDPSEWVEHMPETDGSDEEAD